MPDKELIVVGDRVLIDPEGPEGRTEAGLILPAGAVESQPVQGGWIRAVGPGTPVADPSSLEDEPWKTQTPAPRYIPSQAQVGDYTIFFRKAGVEIEYEGDRLLVVPQSALLVLVRGGEDIPDTWPV